MYDLESPARLVLWPEMESWGSDGQYPTLRQALATAGGIRGERSPWIVTLEGKILRPREIEALRAELGLTRE